MDKKKGGEICERNQSWKRGQKGYHYLLLDSEEGTCSTRTLHLSWKKKKKKISVALRKPGEDFSLH